MPSSLHGDGSDDDDDDSLDSDWGIPVHEAVLAAPARDEPLSTDFAAWERHTRWVCDVLFGGLHGS